MPVTPTRPLPAGGFFYKVKTMSWDTVATSELYISKGLPSDTTSATEFAALTWVKVGEITDVPSVVGRQYQTASNTPVDSAQMTKRKGSYELPDAEFVCAWDESDAGQIIVYDASRSYDSYSFKLKKQNGHLRYFTSQVSKFVEDNGSVDSKVTGKFTLLRQTDTVRAAPTPPAPAPAPVAP